MASKKKRKIKKKAIIVIIVIFFLLLTSIVLFVSKNETSSSSEKKEVKTVEKIKDYDYVLKENQTKYYKSLFKELKSVLSETDVDEEKYAELVSKLFVSDFYNLDNKISKSDIGGTQFVYKDFREDFENLAKESMYKHIESNVYGERKQELPIVNKVFVTIEKTNFKYGEKTDDNAYLSSFEIEYKEDLGYQTKGKLTLIHNDKKLEVAALE